MIAEFINLFFNTSLSGWDVDFSVGRNAIRLERIGHKVIVGELWHNPEWTFKWFTACLLDKAAKGHKNGFFGETAIRCACLAAITAKLTADGLIDVSNPLDIAVPIGDFSAIISGLYIKEMGMPIGNIICCNEDGEIWDLLQQGQLRTEGNGTESEEFPPQGMEQLIYHFGGQKEVWRYLESCWNGAVYEPEEFVLKGLRKNLQVSVIGKNRMEETLSGVFASNMYLLTPETAIAFAGVMDYRVRTKENRLCLILAEDGPECNKDTISKALKISAKELNMLLEKR